MTDNQKDDDDGKNVIVLGCQIGLHDIRKKTDSEIFSNLTINIAI